MAGKPPGPLGHNHSPVIDAGTMCLAESPAPATQGGRGRAQVRDELTPIATYIAGEMNRNAASADVAQMLALNSYSAEACILDFSQLALWKRVLGLGITPKQCIDMQLTSHSAALLNWAAKVHQGGDWDHKPKIASRFNPRGMGGPQHWHLYGDTLYYYQVWSNIHYGYVGRAAGFSEAQLLDGAGLEQIGSTLMRGKIPQRSGQMSGLRAWDDKDDRAAILMGIRLHQIDPKRVSASAVLKQVLASPDVLTKPFAQ